MITTFLFLLGILPPIEDKPIIPMDTIGFNCNIQENCASPQYQIITPNTNWTEYAQAVYELDTEGQFCAGSNITHTFKWNNNGSWVNITSSTNIKLISGTNPKTKQTAQSPEFTCDPTTGTSWVVQALPILNCTNQQLKVVSTSNLGSSMETIWNIDIDDGTCNPPEILYNTIMATSLNTSTGQNVYSTDLTILYWFLGIKILFTILWIL